MLVATIIIINRIKERSMISFKSYLLLESPFDDAVIKWQKELDMGQGGVPLPNVIPRYIDKFKKLRDTNQLSGQEKDISYWVPQSFLDFRRFLNIKEKEYLEKKEKKEARKKISGDAIKVFENDKALVVIPKTHEAAQKYGAGTKWCLTYKEDTYWKNYVLGSGLTPYFIIAKNGSGKVAAMVDIEGYLSSLWDADDSQIGTNKWEWVLSTLEIDQNIFRKSYLEEDENQHRITDNDTYDFFNTDSFSANNQWADVVRRFDNYFRDWDEQDEDGNDIEPLEASYVESIMKYKVHGLTTNELPKQDDFFQTVKDDIYWDGDITSTLNGHIFRGCQEFLYWLKKTFPAGYKFKEGV
jgi:hypothetical protein